MKNVSIPCVGPEVDQLILDFHSCNIKTRGTVVALYFEELVVPRLLPLSNAVNLCHKETLCISIHIYII